MAAIPLFSPEGDAALAALAARATLYAFDYDGTLAPIVARPEDAVAPTETIAALERLAALVPVALVTGRARDDLRARFPFDARYVIGNHGMEGMPDDDPATTAAAADGHARVVAAWTSQWPAAIAAQTADPGIFVENKLHSLSIHYRPAADHQAASRAIQAAIARLTPAPRVIGGKCVFNLMPEGAADKGDALVRLVRFDGCAGAFYIGDDDTDELAFARASANWVTVRVGRVASTAAGFYVDGQADVLRCIDRLVAVLRAR